MRNKLEYVERRKKVRELLMKLSKPHKGGIRKAVERIASELKAKPGTINADLYGMALEDREVRSHMNELLARLPRAAKSQGELRVFCGTRVAERADGGVDIITESGGMLELSEWEARSIYKWLGMLLG